MGAHYDDLPGGASVPAPGADDNGSGVVGMLTIAKQIIQYLNATTSNHRANRTLRFVAFSAEEQGLLGSKEFIRIFAIVYYLKNKCHHSQEWMEYSTIAKDGWSIPNNFLNSRGEFRANLRGSYFG